jgi:hypothetical protein
MKSNEHIKQLIKLSEENPELEIIAKVEGECVPDGDGGGWWGARIGESTIEDYWLPGEIYLFEDDIGDQLFAEAETSGLSAEEQKAFVAQKYDEMKDSGEIKKAIFVTIKP